MFKITTWNVNSLKVRLPQVLAWLESNRPDVLVLQETKLTDENFPQVEIEAAGYHVTFSGQKTYNGVATLSRLPQHDISLDLPHFDDPQRRVLATSIGTWRVVNVYVPNGSSVDSDKYEYKLAWLAALEAFIASELAKHPHLILLGDFNIAPDDRDVHDPKVWEGAVLVSPAERAALSRLFAQGLHDTFRLHSSESGIFSWWDYRSAAFRRNLGLRIDLILASEALKDQCVNTEIDKTARKAERPSDHAPVTAMFQSSGST